MDIKEKAFKLANDVGAMKAQHDAALACIDNIRTTISEAPAGQSGVSIERIMSSLELFQSVREIKD
jgi:hypothetical protein